MSTIYSSVKIDELRQMPAFCNLSDTQLEHLSILMIRRKFLPGQFIFIEGEHANSLWFVAHGRVKIMKQSQSGRVSGLCLMNRGKCFGSCPLFEMEKHPATAQALDEVTLFILTNEAFQNAKQNDPQLVKALLYIYSQRLEHLTAVSEMLGTWTVAERINDNLLLYAIEENGQFVVHLTHEKLAELAGTVREVVTRHLSQLEKADIIQATTKHIVLLQPTKLTTSSPCMEVSV
jgi:CRP-like cAMP-binding protein